MTDTSGTSSDPTKDEALTSQNSEKEVEKKVEEETKNTSEEETSKNEDESKDSSTGDAEELSEAEKVRRAADSKISKMSNEISKYQAMVQKDVASNPTKLYELYETDKELALQIAESNPELVDAAIAAQEKVLEVGENEDGENKSLTKDDLESWYTERRKKDKVASIKEDVHNRQINAIADFLSAHPEVEKGSELETNIFNRFKVYAKPDSKPAEIATILDDALKLSQVGSYETGVNDAVLKGAMNASASQSVGGKGGASKKSSVKLTAAQQEFCNKYNMDPAEYAKYI